MKNLKILYLRGKKKDKKVVILLQFSYDFCLYPGGGGGQSPTCPTSRKIHNGCMISEIVYLYFKGAVKVNHAPQNLRKI